MNTFIDNATTEPVSTLSKSVNTSKNSRRVTKGAGILVATSYAAWHCTNSSACGKSTASAARSSASDAFVDGADETTLDDRRRREYDDEGVVLSSLRSCDSKKADSVSAAGGAETTGFGGALPPAALVGVIPPAEALAARLLLRTPLALALSTLSSTRRACSSFRASSCAVLRLNSSHASALASKISAARSYAASTSSSVYRANSRRPTTDCR